MKTKEILFKVTLKGQGIAQRDTNEQKYMYGKSENCGKIDTKTKTNISLGKANFYTNPKFGIDEYTKQYIRKLKISSAGLRHSIHREYIPFYSPVIFMNDKTRQEFLSKPDALLRGYMYAPENDKNEESIETLSKTIKKSSAYSITDAEITNDIISNIEVRTTSGERTKNSFFFEESVGFTEYKSFGFIDLEKLCFLPTDNRADRICMYPDDRGVIVKNLQNLYGENSVQFGEFRKATTEDILYEEGIVLSNEIANELVKYLMNKVSNIFVGSKNCYAKTTKIEIKYVTDPINDYGDENYITIFDSESKLNTINEVKFEQFDFFKLVDLETKRIVLEAQTIIDNKNNNKKK